MCPVELSRHDYIHEAGSEQKALPFAKKSLIVGVSIPFVYMFGLI